MQQSLDKKFVVGKLVDGKYCYVPNTFLDDVFKIERGLVWKYAKNFSTIRYNPIFGAATSIKSIDRFGNFSYDTIGRFVEEYFTNGGIHAPASFSAGFWLNFFESRKPHHAFDVFFGRFISGGWQEVFANGTYTCPLYRYDINSAYGWAASLGLPDPKFYRVHKAIDRPGLYIIKAAANCDRPPRPFTHHEMVVLATDQEIKAYNLQVSKVLWGVSWDESQMIDPRPAIDATLETFTDGKQILRTFWGKWCSRRGPTTANFSNGVIEKEWSLPNINRHYIWAHLLYARVKMRMHSLSKSALRIYCDSILTKEQLPVDSNLGGWKLEKFFPNGVHFLKTGLVIDRDNQKVFV